MPPVQPIEVQTRDEAFRRASMLSARNDGVRILRIWVMGAVYVEAGKESRYVEDSVFSRIKFRQSDEAEVAIFWVKNRDAVLRAQFCWEELHVNLSGRNFMMYF